MQEHMGHNYKMNFNYLFEKFNGNAFVSLNDKIIFNASYGYSDLANKIKNKFDTKFATASAGKVFVAVGILQLIESGLLNFNDTIGTILKFDLKSIDKNVTIQELLNHTSGVPDYFDETIMNDYEELWFNFPNYKIRTNSDLLPLFINKPMMYPRGSKFQYNNSGFVLLALIIEEITKKSFDEYLSETVFKTCKMTSTGYYELDKLPEKCAANYIFDINKNEYRTNIFSVDAKGTGAGGAFTTINDIKLFWENLFRGKLISDIMLNKMISNQCGNDECYGFGIWLRKEEDFFIPYFEGCDPGVSFISSYNREKNLLIILVSNFGDNVWKIWREILKYYQN